MAVCVCLFLCFCVCTARRVFSECVLTACFRVCRAEAVERSKSVEDVIGFLKKGSLLWKVKSLSKWYRRKYTLDFEHLKINYEPSHKPVCVERDTTCESWSCQGGTRE